MASTDFLNQFSFNLYKQLAAGKNDNFFISPFSISAALSMCYLGARTQTAEQLQNLLCYNNLSLDQVVAINEQFLNHLNSLQDSNLSLNVANKIYPMIKYELKPEFSNSLSKYFNSQTESLDFSKSEESANRINQWVEQQTKNKIQKLLDPSLLNALTRLVLVNAIYFKGNWLNQFDKANTYKEDFHLRDGSTQKVDMMKLLNKKFVFKRNPGGLKALSCEFPYAGNKVAMTVILPHEGVNIQEVENQLNHDTLQKVFLNDTISEKVHAYIPKFKLEYKNELSETFKSMGAKLPFDDTLADFSGISPDPSGLFISKVVHQAVVEVNEEGTEAAAATAAVMMLKCAMVRDFPPEEFKCDRPFLFILHEKANNGILFIGKYMKP